MSCNRSRDAELQAIIYYPVTGLVGNGAPLTDQSCED